jgi:hypothetical protein
MRTPTAGPSSCFCTAPASAALTAFSRPPSDWAKASAATAPLPRQVPSRGPGARGLIACALLALAAGCGAGGERAAEPELQRERLALGASFVGGRATALGELLHEDLIVQPPAPDTAVRGQAAAEYLEQLARESQLTRSELLPVSLSREGGFILERGGWHLKSGDRTLASRYLIRWRESPTGWRVVLWRWTLFR